MLMSDTIRLIVSYSHFCGIHIKAPQIPFMACALKMYINALTVGVECNEENDCFKRKYLGGANLAPCHHSVDDEDQIKVFHENEIKDKVDWSQFLFYNVPQESRPR